MRIRLPVLVVLTIACVPSSDRSIVGASGDTGPVETGFDRDCVDRVDIHPVCECALTLSWSLHDSVDRAGVVALSSSAVDAQSAICTDGLSEDLLATAVYSEVVAGSNEVTIAALSGPALLFLERSGQILDPTIADPSSSSTLDSLSFYW